MFLARSHSTIEPSITQPYLNLAKPYSKKNKKRNRLLTSMISSLDDIKKLRKRLGLTQSDLAKLSGVSQSLIAKLESNRIDPSYKNVKKIMDVLENIKKESEPKIKDIMNKKMISCKQETLVSVAVKKMRRYDISQMPVIENNHVLGMISERTILEAMSEHEDISKLKVKQIIDDAPPIVSSSTSIRIVTHLLKHFSIVIVTSKGKPAGVIAKSDVINKSF